MASQSACDLRNLFKKNRLGISRLNIRRLHPTGYSDGGQVQPSETCVYLYDNFVVKIDLNNDEKYQFKFTVQCGISQSCSHRQWEWLYRVESYRTRM